MGAPAVPHPDATCELRLPPTSYPKSKIKVLLLENIAGTAVEMFREERFQVVRLLGPPGVAQLQHAHLPGDECLVPGHSRMIKQATVGAKLRDQQREALACA